MNKIIEIERDRTMLTSFYSPDRNSHDGSGESFYVGLGVYCQVRGREEWTGAGYEGNVPFETMLRWAIEQGYIKRMVYPGYENFLRDQGLECDEQHR